MPSKRKRLAGLVAIFVVLIGGYALATDSCARGGTNLGAWERHERKRNVLVFVHGIYGGPADTWTCAGRPSWPKMLTNDPEVSDFDIYVAGYDTPYVGNGQSLDEVTASLRHRLESDGVLEDYDKVVFVCHSMGGIVTQELLLTHRQYARRVPLIFFYSTPQTGAQIANLGRAYSRNPLLDQLRANDNYYLRNLERQWLAAEELRSIRRYCAFETNTTKGIPVVDSLSGTRGCSEEALPIASNHLDIVKPCSVRDDAYTALIGAIRKHGRPADKEFSGLLGALALAMDEAKDVRGVRIGFLPDRRTELSRFRIVEKIRGATWQGVLEQACARNPCLSCTVKESGSVSIGVKGKLKKCQTTGGEAYFICPQQSCS